MHLSWLNESHPGLTLARISSSVEKSPTQLQLNHLD